MSLATVPAAYSEVKLVEPAPGAVVPLLTDAQKAYVSMDRQTRREKFADAKFRSEEMGLPADTIQESVEKYVRDLGFTDDDIAKFRSIMLYEEGKK